MPCYRPLQVFFTVDLDGKKLLSFNNSSVNTASKLYRLGISPLSDSCPIPCGNCIGCRVERSRQWAVRCMHEASLFDHNHFLTFTYNNANLPSDGSLVKKDFQDFMKRLIYYEGPVRYYMCGEYGDKFKRPHYHALTFGLSFNDLKKWRKVGKSVLYTSAKLEKIWGNGFCPVGLCSFDSAAYVARYCTKKINGPDAHLHYDGRLPEYSSMSLKPAIGFEWYQKWKSDVFPSDTLFVNGHKCKPPRYYLKLLEKEDPILYEALKCKRREEAISSPDSSYERLLVREKCGQARFKQLIRTFESGL